MTPKAKRLFATLVSSIVTLPGAMVPSFGVQESMSQRIAIRCSAGGAQDRR
jgi:hypothetical protein